MQYYFLLLSFPPLSLRGPLEFSFKQLRDLLELNLSAGDMKKVKLLLLPIDLYNVKALWMGLPLDDKGSFSAKELEELLLVRDESLPTYLLDFLDNYESLADRLAYFPSLFPSLYLNEEVHLTGFLGKFYKFQRETRLVLAALRTKLIGKDIVHELQFEDPFDPLVSFILAQKDASDFTPPVEFEDLKNLFMENSSEPQKLHRAILEYRFEKIEMMKEKTSFSIDRVLAYIAQFLIVEELYSINEKEGKIVVDELSQYE